MGVEEKRLILFFDCGDTIIDESTEVWDIDEKGERTYAMEGNLIPGAKEVIKKLFELGYRMAIVADGSAASFQNLLGSNKMLDYFEALIYSEQIKVCKPNRKMFKAAIGAMDLAFEDTYRIAMIGNNLSRDIRGANELGITSIFQSWTPRYPKTPASETEKPCYEIKEPSELIDLVEKLNEEIIKIEKAR